MKNVQQSIDEARLIVESFDSNGGMTVGFDEDAYTLTAEQMTKIAGALYLADCEIAERHEMVMQLMKLTELYQTRAHEIEDVSLELLSCPWWNFVKLVKLEKRIHEAILRYNSETQIEETLDKLESICQRP
jgi:hypothetical protein